MCKIVSSLYQKVYILLERSYIGHTLIYNGNNMTEQILKRIDAIEAKIDIILSQLLRASTANDTNAEPDNELAFRSFTTKQHAVCQMLVCKLSNAEMADVMGIQEASIKVHVRAANKKLGVNRRSQTALAYEQWMHGIDDDRYKMLAGGLPKDWYPDHVGDKSNIEILKLKGN